VKSYAIQTGARRIFKRFCKAVLLTLVLVDGPAGCAFNAQPAFTGLSLTVTKSVVIPPGRAHAVLQGGRLARASNKFEPYCELEVRNVSGAEPQRIKTGNFQVSSISMPSIGRPRKSYITRSLPNLPSLRFIPSCRLMGLKA